MTFVAIDVWVKVPPPPQVNVGVPLNENPAGYVKMMVPVAAVPSVKLSEWVDDVDAFSRDIVSLISVAAAACTGRARRTEVRASAATVMPLMIRTALIRERCNIFVVNVD
jgi:hypothetical protein